MPRPPLPEKRNRQLNVALTSAELGRVRARAEAAGLRTVDYARAAILRERIVAAGGAAASRFDRLMLESWKRVGNNLNQMARQLNALGSFTSRDVEAVLREVRELIQKASRHGS